MANIVHVLLGAASFSFFKITSAYTFALIPKSIDNPFFDPSGVGCQDHARLLPNVTCLYAGPNQEDINGTLQADIILDLLHNHSVDGLAISVQSLQITGPIIDQAVQAGIPVVTFDSDAPESLRASYIGTDNFFFGRQIAKVLKQLRPEGGTFALLSGAHPNLKVRENGFRQELATNNYGTWTEIPGSPADANGNVTLAIELLDLLAQQNPTAIVPVLGLAMRGDWRNFVDRHRHRNITYASGDAMPNQLKSLDENYAQGLVGQLPYEMGVLAVQALYDLTSNATKPAEIMGTNVLTHIHVPLVLPELIVDTNSLGNLAIVGYILCGLVFVSALAFAYWTFKYRNLYVVRVSQPNFLLMVAAGVVVMAGCIIPLSFDDNGEENYGSDALICMSIPWCGCLGFTVTFSALFSKTMRVNKLFRSNSRFGRVTVTERDVLAPFVILFTLNVIALTTWSILDPLTYTRLDHKGTDGWQRVISTYGACRSQHVARYLIPLAIVNLSALVLANWQAYEARSIQSEFSESKYIGIVMASLLQATLSGIPILFVVKDNPEAFYLVLTFMVFVTCMSVLLLIFVPKIVLADSYGRQAPNEQRRLMRASIRASSHSMVRKDTSLYMATQQVTGIEHTTRASSAMFTLNHENRIDEVSTQGQNDPPTLHQSGSSFCIPESSAISSIPFDLNSNALELGDCGDVDQRECIDEAMLAARMPFPSPDCTDLSEDGIGMISDPESTGN